MIDIAHRANGEIDVFIEYDNDDDVEVPEDEYVLIAYYLIEEGFVKGLQL